MHFSKEIQKKVKFVKKLKVAWKKSMNVGITEGLLTANVGILNYEDIQTEHRTHEHTTHEHRTYLYRYDLLPQNKIFQGV